MEFMLQVLVSLCLISFSVESELICSQKPIVALFGDDVIFPCRLEPPISVSNETVVWTRSNLYPAYVHYYHDGQVMFEHQNPFYYFRTKLFMDGLTNGNVSMKIFGVKLTDAGTYRCSLPSMKKEASIQLIVNPGIICPSEPVKAAVSEDVTLQCHLVTPLNTTNMTTEWRHESQNQTVLLNQHLFPEELTKGNLSLKISSVQLSDSGRYRCSVTRENLQRSCYVNLTVVPTSNFDPTELIYNSNQTTNKTLIIAIVVSIVSAALIATIVIIIIVRRRRHDAASDAAQAVEFWTGVGDFVLTLCGALGEN